MWLSFAEGIRATSVWPRYLPSLSLGPLCGQALAVPAHGEPWGCQCETGAPQAHRASSVLEWRAQHGLTVAGPAVRLMAFLSVRAGGKGPSRHLSIWGRELGLRYGHAQKGGDGRWQGD